MNEDKINHLIDTANPSKLDDLIKKISAMSEDEYAELDFSVQRKLARERDKEALASDMQIERLTLFLKAGGSILLVKPNKWTDPNVWTFNLYESGTICIRTDQEPEFKVGSMPVGGIYRLHVSWGESVYWVDLIDEQEAKDLAEFLGVSVVPFSAA